MANSAKQNNSDITKRSGSKKVAGPKRHVVKRGATSKGGRKARNGHSDTFYQQGRDALSGAYDTAAKAGRALPKLSSNLHLRERGQSLYSMMEERPLVLGAVGLGVGIVLATLLPSIGQNRSHR